MKTLINTILLAAITTLCCQTTKAQNDLIVGQYIHNQYAINPAFAGNREGLTFFASWRKQWSGIENTPTSLLLSGHAPLKSNNLVLGAQIWNQKIHQSQNSGIGLTIGYRFRVGQKSWIGMALQPGVALRKTDWTKVKIIDQDDEIFAVNTNNTSTLLGFGITIYGQKYFFGLSSTSLFISDDFDKNDADFSPSDAQYIATGGVCFGNETIKIQPSVMANYSKKYDIDAIATLTGIWKNFIWLDVAYGSTKELNAGLAIQALPQLRVAYNYSLSMGNLSGYNKGSHEISLQYDLVYKVKTVSPRFF